ncbi:MAG: ABC transporter permease subunit [Acetobacteraceae bacterium]
MPSFVLGLLLVLLFSVQLRWLPSGGQESWRSAILPVITLGVGGAAILARFTRSAMLEVLGQPYIRTASAKGVPWAAVVRRHALPNAAIPTVTVVGFMVGSLIAGAVVVESVFSWPGVGRLLVVAVANRDLAVVQCILLLVATTMVGANLVVDLLYGVLESTPARRCAGALMSAVLGAARRRPRVATAVLLAVLWLLLVLLVALLADLLRPYSITAFDLRNRLAPPLGFGGVAAHPLGTDELGRDVLSRLIVSVRVSLLVAFGATVIGTVFGTTLGFVAAHFRGWVEQAVLMLIDFQAALPFLILALAVLAFFGNSLPLFVCLMGLYGWERHARIARGLAIAAGGQGYAASVRQLGAGPLRVYLGHVLPNIASTLIVSATLSFPELILLESGLSFLGLGGAAAADVPWDHGGLCAGLSDAGAVDSAGAEYRHRVDDAVCGHCRRLAARSVGSDAGLGGQTLMLLAPVRVLSRHGRT